MQTQKKNRVTHVSFLNITLATGFRAKPFSVFLVVLGLFITSGDVAAQDSRSLTQVDDPSFILDDVEGGCSCFVDVNGDGSTDGLDVQDVWDCK